MKITAHDLEGLDPIEQKVLRLRYRIEEQESGRKGSRNAEEAKKKVR